MGLCGRDALGHILLYTSAKEQWSALKALYAPLGLQQLGTKIQAFTGYIAPANAKVADIANDLTTLQANIRYIKPAERPSDTLKISIFFRAVRALDSRFDPLILQLGISGLATDFAVIVPKFIDFERRIGPKEGLKEGALTANIGSKGSRNSRRKEPNNSASFKGRCFNYGKTGHKKSECTTKPKDNPSTGPLATPNGGRGLSLEPRAGREQANLAEEA
jgi:hypothetical protein